MNSKDYRLRVFCVFSFFFFLYLIIGVRLFLIQIYQKDFFKDLAKQQYQINVTLDVGRALIYDRNKKIIAMNRDVSSAFILPRQLNQSVKIHGFLKEYFCDVYRKIDENPERYFFWVERKLTPDRLCYFKDLGLEDIQFIQEPQRFYPYHELASVIGFTDIDNNGIAGIELAFSKQLRGLETKVVIEKDGRFNHLYFEKKITKQGYQGKPLVLTLDHKLQFFACEELKQTVEKYQALAGSVLIMNPDNGEILAMANYPIFDPNSKISPALEITKNHVISSCYELGSVMKMFTGLAALEEGVVGYDEPIDCEGKVAYIEGFRVENPNKHDRILPFCDVMKYSSNIGIAKVALRLGPLLYDHLSRLGFGKKTGIQFPGERVGFVNHPDHWSRSSNIVLSFGYEMMSSLLQLGVASSVIANGGYLVKPKLIKEPIMKEKKRIKLYKDETVRQMQASLEAVGKRYPVKGYRVMGKTGTARMVDEGKYSLKKHLYTFVGMVERDDYRRLIITFIREPVRAHLWAAEVSAPLFQKVAEKMVMYERQIT